MKNLDYFLSVLEVMRSKFAIKIEIDEVDYTCTVFNESKKNEEYLFVAFRVEAETLEEVVIKAWDKLLTFKEL